MRTLHIATFIISGSIVSLVDDSKLGHSRICRCVGDRTDGQSNQEPRFVPLGRKGIAVDWVERCFAVATITGVIVLFAGLIWLAVL